MNDVMDKFRTRLESARGHRTQREFAGILGVPLNSYTNWISGARVPSASVIVQICTQLRVSSDWLLGLDIRVPFGDIREDQPLPISPDLSADLVATRNLADRLAADNSRLIGIIEALTKGATAPGTPSAPSVAN